MKIKFIPALVILVIAGCADPKETAQSGRLDYCVEQAAKTLSALPPSDSLPRNILQGQKEWNMVSYKDWTSGFYPGILWYLYEYTGDEKWLSEAKKFTLKLRPLSEMPAIDHDLGFQMYCSFGNGFRLTGDTAYKRILLASADTLSRLFNPMVGTMLSWPRPVPNMEWPQHNTIMDNMMNLELLFWASKNGGSRELYDVAVQHATTTMRNHFRPDYTSWHVVVYDTLTGQKIKGVTHQGYSDSSMWARGQSWAIYGYTMVYRETKDTAFLNFAQNVADVYLDRLPEDLVPYWDFDDPAIPQAPRDASAAAITASALIELSGFVTDTTKANLYKRKAMGMLETLSSERYRSGPANHAFLLHSTGHKPNGGEVDASINYADYYYIEALLRAEKFKEEKL